MARTTITYVNHSVFDNPVPPDAPSVAVHPYDFDRQYDMHEEYERVYPPNRPEESLDNQNPRLGLPSRDKPPPVATFSKHATVLPYGRRRPSLVPQGGASVLARPHPPHSARERVAYKLQGPPSTRNMLLEPQTSHEAEPDTSSSPLDRMISRLHTDNALPTEWHPRFWSNIVKNPRLLEVDVQNRLLAAVWARIEGFLSPHRAAERQSPPRIGDASLVDAITTVVLGPVNHVHIPTDALVWAFEVARHVLSPERSMSSRWTSLMILGIASRSGPNPLPNLDGLQVDRPKDRKETDWVVVNMLHSLEQTLAHTRILTPELKRQMSDLSSLLWLTWTQDTERGYPRPMYIERAALTSFTRVAAWTGGSIIPACQSRIKALNLLAHKDSSNFMDNKHQALLAGVITSAVLHDPTFDLAAFFRSTQVGDGPRRRIVTQCLKDLSANDFNVAHLFFKQCVRLELEINPQGLNAFGQAACTGKAFLLKGYCFNSPLKDRTSQYLLTQVLQDDFRLWPITEVESLVDIIASGHPAFRYSRSETVMRPGIERALLVLATASRASFAVSAIFKLHKIHGGLVRPSFLTKFSHTTLTHRQYRAAVRLFEGMAPDGLSIASAWRKMLIIRLARGQASQLARHVDHIRLPGMDVDASNDGALVNLYRRSGHRIMHISPTIAMRSVRRLKKLVKAEGVRNEEVGPIYVHVAQTCVYARTTIPSWEVLRLASKDKRVNRETLGRIANIIVRGHFTFDKAFNMSAMDIAASIPDIRATLDSTRSFENLDTSIQMNRHKLRITVPAPDSFKRSRVILDKRKARTFKARSVLKQVLGPRFGFGRVSRVIRTVIGNKRITATVKHSGGKRNGRACRSGLRAIHRLAEFGLRPDRITVNIVVRTLTQWTAGIDASFLRALFDHFTRQGYPAGPLGLAPFKTSSYERNDGTAVLRQVTGPILLVHHIRPLYKTLIRGFRVRGDLYGAELVEKALWWAEENTPKKEWPGTNIA
jgi:hypothetical protein